MENKLWKGRIFGWSTDKKWLMFFVNIQLRDNGQVAYKYVSGLDHHYPSQRWFVVNWIYIWLTHFRLVPPICVSELGQHWFRLWLVGCPAPSHYLNKWWNIVNWTLRNKLQWSLIEIHSLFQEKALYYVVCEMAAIRRGGGCWIKHLQSGISKSKWQRTLISYQKWKTLGNYEE